VELRLRLCSGQVDINRVHI